jgi:radical SAM-linked protein
MQRIRIKYSKGKAVRFISHRDIIRIFERALRRTGLPLKYSQGYNPRIKLSWGPPLKVGHFSEEQFFDLYLAEPFDISRIPALANSLLPENIRVIEAVPVSAAAPSIFSQLTNQLSNN